MPLLDDSADPTPRARMVLPDGHDAEQIHVQITSESSVVVSWASSTGQVAHLNVEIDGYRTEANGTRASILSHRNIVPNTTKYSLSCGALMVFPCKVPGNYSSPLLLHAHVDVEPSTKYRFRIGPEGLWRHFRSPPSPGVRTLRVAVVGDLGQTAYSAQTCRSIAAAHAANPIDVAVLLGDLSYSDANASRWDSFTRQFQASGCSELPWLVLPGNHEIDPDDLSGEPFLAYRQRWRTPEAGPARIGRGFRVIDWRTYRFKDLRFDFGGSFYSVRFGPAHFLALNPYTAAGDDAAQTVWLREALAAVSRSVTPYLIVLLHTPWVHSSAKHQCANEPPCAALRASTQELLESAGANMLFAGHVHAYERSHPVTGVQHFVVGHGGNYERLYDQWGPPEHSAFRAGDHYGWGLLSFDGGTHTWEAFRSSDSLIVDRTTGSVTYPFEDGYVEPANELQQRARTIGIVVVVIAVACVLLCALLNRKRLAAALVHSRTEHRILHEDPERDPVTPGAPQPSVLGFGH